MRAWKDESRVLVRIVPNGTELADAGLDFDGDAITYRD
jgi:hypothetical protein